jgi:hypothetical protein
VVNFFIKPVYAQGAWGARCVSDGDVATIQGIECLFRNLLSVITTLAGIAFGVMLVVGGFKLIFAGGDKQELQAAKRVFTTAFIGLALMIIAWFILLLIQEFTGIQVTQFTIPGP